MWVPHILGYLKCLYLCRVISLMFIVSEWSFPASCHQHWGAGCHQVRCTVERPMKGHSDEKHPVNTFRTVEWGPRSSRLCSQRPRNKALILRTQLLLSWKTQPYWNWYQNGLSSDEGRKLYYFLLLCFDVQISENTMASQRNISFLKH